MVSAVFIVGTRIKDFHLGSSEQATKLEIGVEIISQWKVKLMI